MSHLWIMSVLSHWPLKNFFLKYVFPKFILVVILLVLKSDVDILLRIFWWKVNVDEGGEFGENVD